MRLRELDQLINLLEKFVDEDLLEIEIAEVYPEIHDEFPGSPVEWLTEIKGSAYSIFNNCECEYLLEREVIEFSTAINSGNSICITVSHCEYEEAQLTKEHQFETILKSLCEIKAQLNNR